MRTAGFPGLAIAVVKDGEPWLIEGFGLRRIETAGKVDHEALFHMASVTKMFTAAAVMKLGLDLDEPVVKVVPDFRMRDRRFRKITPRHLLTHTSGLPDVTDFGWDRPEFDDRALERHIAALSTGKLNSDPGAAYSYSDLGFELLGHCVACASGKTYENFVQTEILETAGMARSTLLFREAKNRVAWPHVRASDGNLIPSRVFPYNRRHAPSSTLYSSATDMAKWMSFLLASRGFFQPMWRRSNSTHGKFWLEVGMGFFAGRFRGKKFVGHEGSDIGFRSSVAVFPATGLGIAVFVNHDGDRVKPLMRQLFAELA